MKKNLKGFTLFEVILYLAIFFLMAVALLNFSWDMLDLGTKDRTLRTTVSDARFISERLTSLIRTSSGVDDGASVLDDDNGRLVLKKLGSSDTVTIDIQNGLVTVTETGQPAVALHSADTEVPILRFQKYGSAADGSEYAGFSLALQSVGTGTARAPYEAMTTLRGGAFLRNNGL